MAMLRQLAANMAREAWRAAAPGIRRGLAIDAMPIHVVTSMEYTYCGFIQYHYFHSTGPHMNTFDWDQHLNQDWDQRACDAAERDLAGVVAEIAARYPRFHPAGTHDGAVMPLTWRTVIAIADEAEADLGLHGRHEDWVLARVLRLHGEVAGRTLPALDDTVDLSAWPVTPVPAVFRAIVQAFGVDSGVGGKGDNRHATRMKAPAVDALPDRSLRPGC